MAVRGGFGAEIEVGIARLRSDVAALHRELAARISGAGGDTVSARVVGAELFVIGPSHVALADVAPEHLVLCTIDGEVVEGTPGADGEPVADVLAHAAVYRSMPAVGGIVHASSAPHSSSDQAIPIGPSVDSSDGALGVAIADVLARHGVATALMPGHGVYTTGVDARAAVDEAQTFDHAKAGG